MTARISQKVAVGAVFVAAMFMSIMDTTIVNVALPTIGRDFGVSPTAVDSISIAYLVSLAVFIPASGWLGDRFGGKRVLLAAIVVFTAASALCGLASSRAAFLAAAAICLCAVAFSLSIRDADAASTIPGRSGPHAADSPPAPAAAA